MLALLIAAAIATPIAVNNAIAEPLVDTTTLPSRLQKSEHRQVFDEAVHILGGNVNVISQWTRPVRLVVVGDITLDDTGNGDSGTTDSGTTDSRSSVEAHQDSAADYARAVIAEIVSLVNLTVEVADDSYRDAQTYLQSLKRSARFTLSDCVEAESAGGACGNFFVIFADVAEMEAITRAIPLRPVYQKAFSNPQGVKCFFSPFQTAYMEIRQALVFVNKDLPREMVRTCLQEEIYQSFGMFNDYTGSAYYSFNNKIEPKVITRYDRALLETIYDSSFKQGAPVFAVVRKLMERLGLDPFTEE